MAVEVPSAAANWQADVKKELQIQVNLDELSSSDFFHSLFGCLVQLVIFAKKKKLLFQPKTIEWKSCVKTYRSQYKENGLPPLEPYLTDTSMTFQKLDCFIVIVLFSMAQYATADPTRAIFSNASGTSQINEEIVARAFLCSGHV